MKEFAEVEATVVEVELMMNVFLLLKKEGVAVKEEQEVDSASLPSSYRKRKKEDEQEIWMEGEEEEVCGDWMEGEEQECWVEHSSLSGHSSDWVLFGVDWMVERCPKERKNELEVE